MPKRFLVVDDSMLSRLLVRNIIEQALPDATIIEASNAEDAIGKTINGQSFDCALVDLTMPGTSGLELYRQLTDLIDIDHRALLTANAGVDFNRHGHDEGIICIDKPFSEASILPFITHRS